MLRHGNTLAGALEPALVGDDGLEPPTLSV